jgi:hypothetical protein
MIALKIKEWVLSFLGLKDVILKQQQLQVQINSLTNFLKEKYRPLRRRVNQQKRRLRGDSDGQVQKRGLRKLLQDTPSGLSFPG